VRKQAKKGMSYDGNDIDSAMGCCDWSVISTLGEGRVYMQNSKWAHDLSLTRTLAICAAVLAVYWLALWRLMIMYQ